MKLHHRSEAFCRNRSLSLVMITVLGSINVDLVIEVPRLPDQGETALGLTYDIQPGGKGANQALAAHRAGAKTVLVGAVGRDEFAETALATLRDEGMELTHIRRSLGFRTGLASVAIDARGHNQIVVAAGANHEVTADDLPEGAADRWKMLLLQMEIPSGEVERAISLAYQAGGRVLLNLAPAVPISEPALDAVEVLIVNAPEARTLARFFALSGGTPQALAKAIAERRGRAVVVTAGEEGAFLAQPAARTLHFEAPQVAVFDTLGAGDAFVGAFAAALDAGMPQMEACRRGVAAGSLACTRAGAQAAMPRLADIEALAAQIAIS